jgi:hypothetical protein
MNFNFNFNRSTLTLPLRQKKIKYKWCGERKTLNNGSGFCPNLTFEDYEFKEDNKALNDQGETRINIRGKFGSPNPRL